MKEDQAQPHEKDELLHAFDRAANYAVKVFILGAAIYLVLEVGFAFASGAVERIVR